MNTPLITDTVPATESGQTPGPGRRTALLITGLLGCAVPTVFAFNLSRTLLTGLETDHRFHQLTGQGLILCALWLAPLVGMLIAGWRGHRPASGWGWVHLSFVVTGIVCSAFAPGGGAPILMALIAVTGGLVWLALPERPQLVSPVQLHPAIAPVALLSTALYVPYAIDQVRLQNEAVSGLHAENPHLFDMAWLVATFMALTLIAALLPGCRHLSLWAGAGSVVLGVAGLATAESVGLSAGALALGVLLLLVGSASHRTRVAVRQ